MTLSHRLSQAAPEQQREAWGRYRKGSCHRHEECMYRPCLALASAVAAAKGL